MLEVLLIASVEVLLVLGVPSLTAAEVPLTSTVPTMLDKGRSDRLTSQVMSATMVVLVTLTSPTTAKTLPDDWE